VSGNFRAPSDPQGYYPIPVMMDDIAYELKMDPVDFILKNMVSVRARNRRSPTITLDECIRPGAEMFRVERAMAPNNLGRDPGPVKRGAGGGVHDIPVRGGTSSAVIHVRCERALHRCSWRD